MEKTIQELQNKEKRIYATEITSRKGTGDTNEINCKWNSLPLLKVLYKNVENI